MDEGGRDRDMEDLPEIVGGEDVPAATTTRAAVAAKGNGEAGDEE